MKTQLKNRTRRFFFLSSKKKAVRMNKVSFTELKKFPVGELKSVNEIGVA